MGRKKSSSGKSLLVESPWLAALALLGLLPVFYPQWVLFWLVGWPVSAVWGLVKCRDGHMGAGACYFLLCPFWPVLPAFTLVLSRRARARLGDLVRRYRRPAGAAWAVGEVKGRPPRLRDTDSSLDDLWIDSEDEPVDEPESEDDWSDDDDDWSDEDDDSSDEDDREDPAAGAGNPADADAEDEGPWYRDMPSPGQHRGRHRR